MKSFIGIVVFLVYIEWNNAIGEQTYNFEKLRNPKLMFDGRRQLQGYAYPQPLPSSVSPLNLIPTPYSSIIQGIRLKGDVRVYHRRFNYKPMDMPHSIFLGAELDCELSHISFETDGGIPSLLRGGVGYTYFRAAARAKMGDALTGRIRAYCRNHTAALRYIDRLIL